MARVHDVAWHAAVCTAMLLLARPPLHPSTRHHLHTPATNTASREHGRLALPPAHRARARLPRS
eukprot:366448-Prymnesium_polylepis.1